MVHTLFDIYVCYQLPLSSSTLCVASSSLSLSARSRFRAVAAAVRRVAVACACSSSRSSLAARRIITSSSSSSHTLLQSAVKAVHSTTAAQQRSTKAQSYCSVVRRVGVVCCLTTYLIGGQCSFLKHRNLTGARPIPTYCDSRRVDQRTSRLTIHRQGLRPSGSCIGRATSRTEHNTGVLLLTQEDSR